MIVGIGEYERIIAKRASMVDRLSTAARHANFPRLYARPMPAPPPIDDSAAVARLQREKDQLGKENSDLRGVIATLQAQLSTSTMLIAQKIGQRKNSVVDVIAAFLIEFNARRADGDPPWTVGHLTSERRARSYAMPRHVCIWLVRQLCTQISLPCIGKQFGNRDHTSVMHACARAAHWLQISARARDAADATLLRFGGIVESRDLADLAERAKAQGVAA